jgi:phosphoribosylglycinamide synthetase-like protein
MASGGYPGGYAKGKVIHGLDDVAKLPNTKIFHAGTSRAGEQIVTNGGGRGGRGFGGGGDFGGGGGRGGGGGGPRGTGGMRMGGGGGRGGRGGGGESTNHRFNATLGVTFTNVLNHFNPGGYVGTMTSPFFGQATSVNTAFGGGDFGGRGGGTANNRRVDLSLRLTF